MKMRLKKQLNNQKLLMPLFLFIVLVCNQFLFSQTMENHLWKQRVLLIYTEDKNSADYQQQISLLEKEIEELKERKLVVYNFTKTDFLVNFESAWKNSNELFTKFNPNKATFKIWLIGLDGGIKLAQPTVLSKEKLFAIIDGMPMRKREIRNNN